MNLQSWTKQIYNNYPLCKSNQRSESQWPVASMLLLLSFVVVVVVCMIFYGRRGEALGGGGGLSVAFFVMTKIAF